jgi:hypothetical protein
MAIICKPYNILFVMTPRTACTALGELLCRHYGGEFLPSEDILDSDGWVSVQKKHSTLSELLDHRLLTATETRSLLKISAVRNPYDSLVSLYLKKRYKYQPLLRDPWSWVNRLPGYAEDMRYCQIHSFNEWVLKVCHRKIVKRLLGFRPSMFSEYTRDMDVILRYEDIEKDLRDAFNKAGIAWKADIPNVNSTAERNGRDYRSFYSRSAAFVAGLAYSYDLRTYGYEF